MQLEILGRLHSVYLDEQHQPTHGNMRSSCLLAHASHPEVMMYASDPTNYGDSLSTTEGLPRIEDLNLPSSHHTL